MTTLDLGALGDNFRRPCCEVKNITVPCLYIAVDPTNDHIADFEIAVKQAIILTAQL